MRGHLDQTLDEAEHRLGGDFPADIRDYDRIHRHVLMMADAISTGIVKQFRAVSAERPRPSEQRWACLAGAVGVPLGL